jgi:hypothetical protein
MGLEKGLARLPLCCLQLLLVMGWVMGWATLVLDLPQALEKGWPLALLLLLLLLLLG